MRTRWQNLDWIVEAERGWIERQLAAIGGEETGLDRVDFIGPGADPPEGGEWAMRILGKWGKAQITAVRRGPSAREAFEAALGAFVASAEWTVESLTPSGSAAPLPQPAHVPSARERLDGLRAQTWTRLAQAVPRAPLWIPSPKLPPLLRVRLPREQVQASALRLRSLSRAASRELRTRLEALPRPVVRLPRVRLPAISLPSLSIPRVSAPHLRALRLPSGQGPREWVRAVRPGSRRLVPTAAAVAGFSVIGLAAFQGESFTGRTLPIEPAPPSQLAYYAVVEPFTLADLEASSFRAVATLPESAPAAAEPLAAPAPIVPGTISRSARDMLERGTFRVLEADAVAYSAVAEAELRLGEAVFRAIAR